MIKSLMLTLDHDQFRFTPDGKVAVMDIIAGLCVTDEPEMVWEELVLSHPELYAYCDDFVYKDETIKVVDGKGFYVLKQLLFQYMMKQWREAV